MSNRINLYKFYPRFVVVRILKIYQKTFSPDHGLLKIMHPHGYCRFTPTCSDYAIQAVEKYGIIRGGSKALSRVLRCNPWSKGGYDPLK